MGGCCCKSEPQLAGARTDPASELTENRTILSQQDKELSDQLALRDQLAKELAYLQNKTREADHVLLTSQEKQFTLKAAFELEEQHRELQRISSALSKTQEDCKAVETSLREEKPDLEAVKSKLTEIHSDLTHSHKGLKAVEEKLTALKKAYEDEESARLQRIQERSNRFEASLRIPAHWVSNHMHRFWLIWRTKPPMVELSTNEVRFSTSSPTDNRELLKDTDLHGYLLAEYQRARDNSPFANLQDELELDERLLEKLLAESLTARAASDSGVMPFPEFFRTFLAGTRPEIPAGAVASTLRKLDTAGRRTSQFLASLLHIGSGFPVFPLWSHLISLIFASVRDILDKKGRLKGETELPLETRLAISEVLEFIYLHFKDNTHSGEDLIRLLRPPSVSTPEYSLFVLSHKMNEKHVESLGLFRRVDAEGKGRIKLSQFVRGVKDVLGVWLNQNDLFNLVKGLAKGGADELSRVEFLKLNMKTYLQNANSELYTISLLEMLEILHQAFVIHSQRVTVELIGAFGSEEVGDEVDFAVRVRRVSGSLSEADVASMWREVSELKQTPGVSSLEAAVRVLLRHEVSPNP